MLMNFKYANYSITIPQFGVRKEALSIAPISCWHACVCSWVQSCPAVIVVSIEILKWIFNDAYYLFWNNNNDNNEIQGHSTIFHFNRDWKAIPFVFNEDSSHLTVFNIANRWFEIWGTKIGLRKDFRFISWMIAVFFDVALICIFLTNSFNDQITFYSNRLVRICTNFIVYYYHGNRSYARFLDRDFQFNEPNVLRKKTKKFADTCTRDTPHTRRHA